MYTYYNNCINWPRHDVSCPGGLSDMIRNSREITRHTFLRHVSRADLRILEHSLGYDRRPHQGFLTMAADRHVSYHRSKLHDHRVYYFSHSGIEYVFINRVTS